MGGLTLWAEAKRYSRTKRPADYSVLDLLEGIAEANLTERALSLTIDAQLSPMDLEIIMKCMSLCHKKLWNGLVALTKALINEPRWLWGAASKITTEVKINNAQIGSGYTWYRR
jgi:hypothetical protein